MRNVITVRHCRDAASVEFRGVVVDVVVAGFVTIATVFWSASKLGKSVKLQRALSYSRLAADFYIYNGY